jgi:NADH dehydrogenase
MSDSWITVFGGTGFLGRRIVERLAGDGVKVRVVARNPDRASAIELPPGAKVERLRADLRDPESIAAAVAGARGVVNAVGLYVERGGETFDAVHVAGAACVAEQAAKAGVARLVHISGIGVDGASDSAYIRARANGEAAVHEAFPAATILRPSVVFAPDDNFINLLLRMARVLPVLPLFGDGGTMLQPVFAGDVALAAARALDDPAAAGKTYELGGPVPYSYRNLLHLVTTLGGHRRPLLPVPFPIWEIQARLAGILPNPPLTSDQVALMRHDNLASPDLPGLADLGVTPTSLEATLPEYPALRAMSRGDG